jgi:Flp pilus assembly pilin Flp
MIEALPPPPNQAGRHDIRVVAGRVGRAALVLTTGSAIAWTAHLVEQRPCPPGWTSWPIFPNWVFYVLAGVVAVGIVTGLVVTRAARHRWVLNLTTIGLGVLLVFSALLLLSAISRLRNDIQGTGTGDCFTFDVAHPPAPANRPR